jgi:adenosylcobinamide-GDP ribazoletransferase
VKDFITAFQILTSIPLSDFPPHHDELTRSVVYFPIVGFTIGLLLFALTFFLLPFLPAGPLAVLLTLVLIFITGGLHSDGLADLCDGLFSGRSREEMLLIMKDSRIGPFGVLALIAVFFLKYALFVEVITHGWLFTFLLMGVLSRWAMVLAAYLGTYARERGTAQPFIGKVSMGQILGATIISLILIFAINVGVGIISLSLVFLLVLLFKQFLYSKIGGLTGDSLGALNEISETLVLLSVLVSDAFLEFA